MMSKLLFLTGIGRSGTTLLQQMLHAHSQIDFKPETHFFKSYIVPLLTGKSISELNFKSNISKDVYIKRLSDVEISTLVKLNGKEKELENGFRDLLCNSNLKFGADKDTEYVRYLRHLKLIYPDAFLINIIRDPRDVVLSRKKTPWGSKRSLTFHAAEYVYYFKKNRKEGPQLFGDNYIEVQFETLLENPEKEMERVLSRLGLSLEETVLKYSQNSNSLIADDEKEWKGNARKPIVKDNSNKWETELDKGVIGLIESEIGMQMQSLGYKLSGYKKNLLKAIEFKTVMAAFEIKSKREWPHV